MPGLPPGPAYGFGAELRMAEYARMQQYAFSNLDHFSTPSLVTRLTTDITVMQNAVNAGTASSGPQSGHALHGGGPGVLSFNARLALVFVISLRGTGRAFGAYRAPGRPALQSPAEGRRSSEQAGTGEPDRHRPSRLCPGPV